MNDCVVLVVNDGGFTRQNHPVAVLEITDGVGKRSERNGVGAQVHLATAIADGERRAVARANHQIFAARRTCGKSSKMRSPPSPRHSRARRAVRLSETAARASLVAQSEWTCALPFGLPRAGGP